jgi:transposase
MGAPVSREIREAVVRARRERELTYEELAELFAIGRASVSRILRLERETGDVEPRPHGGGNFSPLQGRVARLLVTVVKDLSDASVSELTAALIKRTGASTSRSAVYRALRRLGYSRKKRHSGR